MAASYHARSNSLPTRQHPIVSQIDENLNRLRASQSASTSSSIGHNLSGIQDLHECVDVLLQFPLTQQALDQEKQRKWLKSFWMDLSCSWIRRGAAGLANDFRKYLTSRKAMKRKSQGVKELEAYLNKLKTLARMARRIKIEPLVTGFKLMHRKKVMCEEEQKANEILSVKSAVHSRTKSKHEACRERAKGASRLELSIQDLVEGLETLSSV
ncbi:uncharacterized protein LOC128285368 [Gossypium arboreum]|uniref:uncharacterized protein LOC128285368 n=1 Tax=Gossypium arboreum TaxID=29729 RepID=UPI0022F1C9B2|nr:uncharacterized protein LOC128285368 [Gossypium arboreum]